MDKTGRSKLQEIKGTLNGNQSCEEKLSRIIAILGLHRDSWPMIAFKTGLGLMLLFMVLYLVVNEFVVNKQSQSSYLITWMTLLAISAGLLSSCISGMLTFNIPLVKASGPLAFSGVLLYLMVMKCDIERQEDNPTASKFTDAIMSVFEIKEAHAQEWDAGDTEVQESGLPKSEKCGGYRSYYQTRIYYPAGVSYLKSKAFDLKQCMGNDKTTVYSAGTFVKALYNNLFVQEGQYELWVRYNELVDEDKIDDVVGLLDTYYDDHADVKKRAVIATRAQIEIYLWPVGFGKPF